MAAMTDLIQEPGSGRLPEGAGVAFKMLRQISELGLEDEL